MPIRRRGKGWQYGSSGKVYYGKAARSKAVRQGRAIQANKRRKHRR